MNAGVAHWDGVYERSATTSVSWYQPEPTVSVELIAEAGLDLGDPILDVGGGASTLVDRLVDGGYRDVTVLDIAEHALQASRERLGERADRAHWVTADLLDWQPSRRYRLWHDRAVFHFLTGPAERERYRAAVRRALEPDGALVIATFALDGPQRCSGLPTARYGPEELGGEFDGFRVVRTAREEHHTPSGAMQPFTWLLLRSGGQ